MSSQRKKKPLRYKAADKGPGKNDIPTAVGPNAVRMADGANGADRAKTTFRTTPLRDPGQVDVQFHTDGLTTSDERDVLMAEKLDLQTVPAAGIAATPGVTPFGKLIASDADFAWLQNKRDQEAEANFQQWFATNFDRMSPTQKKYAREIFPQFYAEREKLLDKDLALAGKLAKLKLLGIQNREDLLLSYAAEAGFIDPKRMQHLLNPEEYSVANGLAVRQAKFVRGLFNPRRLPRGDFGIQSRLTNAQLLTGKSSVGLDNNFASTLGTDGFGVASSGLSAQSFLPSADERVSQFSRQLTYMGPNM